MSKKNRNKWKFNPARRKRPIDPKLMAILDEAVAEKREAAEMVSGTEETVSEEMAAAAGSAAAAGAEAAAENGAEEIREMAEFSEAEETPEEEEIPETAEVQEAAENAENEAAQKAGETPETRAIPEEEEIPEEDEMPEENEIPGAEEITDNTKSPETELVSEAKELPDYFFDEEDEEEEEDVSDVSLYTIGSKDKKKAKKKEKKKERKRKKAARKKLAEPCRTNVITVGKVSLGDGTPKLCVPITGETREEIASQAVLAAKMAPDMAEWRVDYFENAADPETMRGILSGLKEILGNIPIIFTYRTESEGGHGRIGWEQYASLLGWAAGVPEADLIDVEAMGLDVDTEGLIRVIHSKGKPVIASVHYCNEMPDKDERKEAIRFMAAAGGDILKIAALARTKEEVLDMMTWTQKQSRRIEQPLITAAMGDIGKLSRISGGITGSAVTYGSIGRASAPGQIPADELRVILELLHTPQQ
ncbi:MAG: type I 3-dehydroquinate dehydratase [Eubacterium sp.]|nr:type I 3-dehydroquinate dehydratase [Eubacterium sp.]